MSGATDVRFMGKIFGTKKDYWVCSGTLNQIEEPNQDAMIEARGAGGNSKVFWVTDNILNDWI